MESSRGLLEILTVFYADWFLLLLTGFGLAAESTQAEVCATKSDEGLATVICVLVEL
jgi:hypothetical protein